MRRKSFLPQFATAMILAWCLSSGRGAAEVRLSGTQERVVLQTQDATMPEILAALRSAFGVEVKLKGATARKFTGVYTGPLRQVLSRLLTGEDYILRSGSEGMSILLIGRSAADNAAAPSSPVAASQGSRLVALRQGRVKRNSD
jgi:hypothetical protein